MTKIKTLNTKYKILIIILLFVFLFNSTVLAAIPNMNTLKTNKFGLTNTAQKSGFTTATAAPTIAELAGQMVGLILSLLGVVFMVLIVYGGFMWMMARGNEEEAKKAKDVMINAAIGAVIVFSAYALSSWIITNLYLATKTK